LSLWVYEYNLSALGTINLYLSLSLSLSYLHLQKDNWRAETWQALLSHIKPCNDSLWGEYTHSVNIYKCKKKVTKMRINFDQVKWTYAWGTGHNLMKVGHCTAFTHLKALVRKNFIGLSKMLFEVLGFLVVRNLENGKRRKWSEMLEYSSLRHFLSSNTVKRPQLHR